MTKLTTFTLSTILQIPVLDNPQNELKAIAISALVFAIRELIPIAVNFIKSKFKKDETHTRDNIT